MKYLRIDSQILTSFSRCERRCNFHFQERLESKMKSKYLEMGSGVHVGLESYYNDLKLAVPFKERVEKALITANTYMVTETELSTADIAIVLLSINEYTAYRREDRIEVKMVEQPFSKEMFVGKDLLGEDITILGEGKIDLIFNDENGDGVMDHKSSSRNFELTDMVNQFFFYNWATDLSVTHNRIGFQKSLSPADKFKRTRFKYSDDLRADWKRWAIKKSLQYAYSLQTGEWEPNYTACEGNFGFFCAYQTLCKYPSMAEQSKKLEFKIGEVWDVFKEKNT